MKRYGLAVIMAVGAFLFRQWFVGQFGSTVIYIFLYPAVLITAVLAGVLPGLLATAIAALLSAVWILPPAGQLWPKGKADLLGLGIFSTMSILICLTTGFYHRMLKKMQALEKQSAMQESEERFRTLADNIDQLAWMADEKGDAFWYNQRWFDYTGTSFEEMQGWGWQKVHHPDHVQRVVKKVSDCYRTGETWEDTFPLRRKDGAYRWFLSRAIPIRDEDGTVKRWFGTNTDVTEIRNTEEALRAAKEAAEDANRAKSEFLANVSHELRTPMTVILGALEHLLESGSATDQRHFLEMANTSAHRLLGIIDDLLDITRIEARRLKIEESPFNLRESVRQTAEMFVGPAREKGLQFRWEMASQVPTQVVGDPKRLGQVLANLLGNAIKFTKQGEVALMVDVTREGIVFTVRDTGIGIPAEKLDRIFEPFNQVDSSLTRPYGGTGLGLAICRELVALMNGTIRAEIEIARGSVFSVILPLQEAGALTSPETATPRGDIGSLGGILLAEDEPMIQDLVSLIMRQRGWDITVVENGRQAVSRWQGGGIKLILMDVQMPDMNGLEATRLIRQLEKEQGGRTCIFGLTAHARIEDQQECLAAGMDGVLTKPFRIEQMDHLIKNSTCIFFAGGG